MKELSKVVLRTNHAIKNQLQIVLCGLDIDSTDTQKEVAEKAVNNIVKGLLEVEGLIQEQRKEKGVIPEIIIYT